MIDFLLTLVLFALFDRMRGTDLFEYTTSNTLSRVVSFTAMAFTACISAESLWTFPIAFAGNWIGYVPGLGKYLGMTTGFDSRHEDEAWWIDHILDFLEFKCNITNIQVLGTIGAMLRFTYFIPKLVGLILVNSGSWWVLLGVPALGGIFGLTGLLGDKGWKIGESIRGAILGGLVHFAR